MGRPFGFIIIKADRKPGPIKNGIFYRLKKAREDVNLCGPFFANLWVARDKFMKLARGENAIDAII
jgi:hypothetical protein